MTYGEPMLPIMFSVVLDTVVYYWESLVTGASRGDSSNDDEAGQTTAVRTIWIRNDGQRRAVEVHARLTVQAAFFNAYNGMVDSTNLVWLQTAFDTLTGIFDRVGLRKNVRKTAGMAFQPCRAVRVQADEAYKCQITREGWSNQER